MLSVILQLIIVSIHNSLEDGTGMKRMFILLGGELPYGIIQGITYFLFFAGMLELIYLNHFIELETDGFSLGLLPEREQYILSPQDVNNIKLQAIEIEKKRKYLITDMIKKACTKYRANKSTSEALEIVSSQAKLNLSLAESEQSIIRYVAWAIPSVGFIGTIIGIAQSLGYADQATSPEGIQKVTQALNIAFDTTLVALFLSIILMLTYHLVQEKVEKFHSHLEEYVIENLINRIYKQ
jgi:chemotaxis protein MotA